MTVTVSVLWIPFAVWVALTAMIVVHYLGWKQGFREMEEICEPYLWWNHRRHELVRPEPMLRKVGLREGDG